VAETQRFHAIGRRKTSVAKIWLTTKGKGHITINGKGVPQYFSRQDLVLKAEKPLDLLEVKGQFDIKAQCKGGGVAGQADAFALGVARALVAYNPDFKPRLKDKGLLTRDPRQVERKKYGRPKARKRFQFSKR